jgi:glycosyltransferase involved in cell wall biosynthesis
MLVSILVPVYKGAEYLNDLIRNVQAQTYSNFELILVDDASPDHTAEIVGQIDDPRIKYVRHEINKGADQARKTGLEISRGEIISFLDQDDLFHPDKLNEHLNLFLRDPSLGVAYNSRFIINESPESIYGQWCAPSELTLADLVLGYPFAPSDMLIRREWALRSDIWDASFAEQGDEIIVNGGEIVFLGRLFLAGCRFASIPRVLNYRRYHPGRVLSDLKLRCRSELRCQEIIMEDPRCPASFSSLRNVAYMNTYVGFASLAFYQGEFDFGYDCLQKASACQPDIIRGFPAPIIQSLVERSIPDETQDIEKKLTAIFSLLPPDLSHLRTQQAWALGRSHLIHVVGQTR